jgi:hypothetical protein
VPATSARDTSSGAGGSATDGAASTASAASNSAGNSGGQGTSQPTVTTAGTGATGSQHDASGNATETALLVGSPRAEAPPSGMIGLASIEGAASVDSSLARLGPAMVRLAAADFVGSIGMPPDDLNADSVDGAAPVAPVAPRLVVVGPGDSVVRADEALVGSLAAAIDRDSTPSSCAPTDRCTNRRSIWPSMISRSAPRRDSTR